ncbi:hypothetical protein B0H19DRAFT_1224494 [Mycena capillaripes]|nr:hypothetical protein B0H19DRAFT_1224494 [Mycena capillaripes]
MTLQNMIRPSPLAKTLNLTSLGGIVGTFQSQHRRKCAKLGSPRPILVLYLRHPAVQLSLTGLKALSETPLPPSYAHRPPMAAEHSPLYRTIAEQVSAFIDIAVTDPVTNWGPTYTGRAHELPMEVLYDYDEPFPLPTGLDSILGISKISNDHRINMEQVMCDLLDMPEYGGVSYFIKELRLAYRSRMYFSIFPWDISHPTPLVSNYTLLARAEGALRSYRNNPRTRSNVITVKELGFFFMRVDPDSGNEKPLPSYIGGRVHARLVEAKARLSIHRKG